MTTPQTDHSRRDPEITIDTHLVDCCVVGGGPAGIVLAILLARKGIRVHVLDTDDRESSADLVHAGVLEVLDTVGLAQPLLEHARAHVARLAIKSADREIPLADFSRLETRFPFAALVPETRLVEFLSRHARDDAGVSFTRGAGVTELVRDDGRVVGARVPGLEIRAKLTVVFDGRFFNAPEFAGLTVVRSAPTAEVLWFRLPRVPGDSMASGGGLWAGSGRLLIQLDGDHEWRLGMVMPSGRTRIQREAGLPAFKQAVARLAPEFADRLESLVDWRSIQACSVESGRLGNWHRPGLLFLGEAAHPMMPMASVGLGYAIQDAVEAANVLADPLRTGAVATAHLIEIQRRRELASRIIQAVMARIQKRILAEGPRGSRPFRLPLVFKIPGFSALLTRLIARGPWRVRVD